MDKRRYSRIYAAPQMFAPVHVHVTRERKEKQTFRYKVANVLVPVRHPHASQSRTTQDKMASHNSCWCTTHLDIYFSLPSIIGGRHGAQQSAKPASLIADAGPKVATIDVTGDNDALPDNLVGICPRTVIRSHAEGQALPCFRCRHTLRCRLRCQSEAMYWRHGTEECHHHHKGGYRHRHVEKAGCGIMHDQWLLYDCF